MAAPDPRTRAVMADHRVANLEHKARAIITGILVLILLFVIASTTLSAIAAWEGRDAAQSAKSQSLANHKTEIANEKILHEILASQQSHRQTVAGEKVIVRDLRRLAKALNLAVHLAPIPTETLAPQPSPASTHPSSSSTPKKPHPRTSRTRQSPTVKPRPTPTPTCTLFLVTMTCTKL